MSTLIYQIEFFDYWHTGTGLVSAANSDAIVQKDKNNLPFIPGKTLKGLLREAAEILLELGHPKVNDNFIKDVFGEKKLEDNEEKRQEAKSFFGNANLSADLSHIITENSHQKYLYRQITSTAIEANGQAKDYSLRSIEVTIPVVLYATIQDFEEQHQEAIEACLGWVKRMGLNRNRGLGRCQFSIYSPENQNT